jgi:hypothetical protein
MSETLLGNLLTTQSAHLFDEQGFAVHCPMVLTALARMGATDQQLQTYFSDWENDNLTLSKMHRAALMNNAITIETWRDSLNKSENFGQLQQFFQTWIAQTSANAVMLNVLSQIPKAPASVAFHGFIRLAYGLEANHHGEIAAGLAALVVRNFPIELQRPNNPPRAASVAQGLSDLARAMSEFTTPEINITARIRAVVTDPRFARALQIIPADPFNDMAVHAIVLYGQQRNFTGLHMVTALHAARVIFARLPSALFQQYLPSLWIAYCAAFVSIGGTTATPIHAEKQTWSELIEQAKTSTRDHMIKMIYTCYQEYLNSPDPEIKKHYLAGANTVLLT